MPNTRSIALLLAAALAAASAFAQGPRYPERPVRLVIPFTPGGGTDILGRFLGTRLSAELGQPVVIENVPGANGLVARQMVARQPADGHVLMLGSNSTHAIAPVTARESLADLQRDFAPVTIIAETTLVLAVSPASPLKTLRQYIEASRTKPLTFGTFVLGALVSVLAPLGQVQAAVYGALYFVTVRGDLNLLGAINSINTTVTNLEVMDKIVTLAYPSNPAVPVVDGAANDRSGLRVEGLPSNVSTDPAELYDKTFLWHSSTAGVQQLGTSNANAESFWEMRGGSMRLAHKKTNGTVVSYGFRINQQDELEIVKYTKTSTDAVPRYHRVAKFGRA